MGKRNRYAHGKGSYWLTISQASRRFVTVRRLQPSIPVGFTSSQWGMLPYYASKTFPGTQLRYVVNGNSFICAVEFGRQGSSGKKVTARSLLAGGESGNENSSHFFDQGKNYANGVFKDVLFYKDDVLKHAERSYHPGE
ncbi:MAG: penicillin acylase family protein [Bacteroidetes bacterium]|nr:penicillin acylase family protein [Bacteroidota bacterium]